jgi:uncharacterized membrane protein YsdA (DUF1294 family)
MKVFRHKTAKAGFHLKLWLVTAAQVAVVTVYLVWIRPFLF